MSEVPLVLKTLESYIDRGAGDRALTGLTLDIGRDRRFTSLLLVSLVGHALVIAMVLRMDWLLFHSQVVRKAGGQALVKVTEVAPPPERLALRTRPEPIERADISRLKYDPSDIDDQRLLSRSPKPSTQKGSGGSLASALEIERRLRAMTRARRAGTGENPSDPSVGTRQPPEIAEVHPTPSRQPDGAPVVELPAPRSTGAPPAPQPTASAENAPDSPPGSRRGTGSESTALGMTSAQGNYIAYVRAKIARINEANLPRGWIEGLLQDKVSADFSLTVRRDGRVALLQLRRSSGYDVLDRRAREAIILASPFEGFPQAAGDSLPFIVTVYYTPYR
jgi:outer membrane biosynthesis protein TonB